MANDPYDLLLSFAPLRVSKREICQVINKENATLLSTSEVSFGSDAFRVYRFGEIPKEWLH